MQVLGELWIVTFGQNVKTRKQGKRRETSDAQAMCRRKRRANMLPPSDKSLARIPKSGLITSTSSG